MTIILTPQSKAFYVRNTTILDSFLRDLHSERKLDFSVKDICRLIFIYAMSFVKIEDLIGFVSEYMLISTYSGLKATTVSAKISACSAN